MKVKKFLITTTLVYLAYEIIDFIIRNILLSDSYGALKTIWRPDVMQKMWVLYLTPIVFSVFFVLIYQRFQKGNGILDGLTYGIFTGLLITPLKIYNQYAFYPLTIGIANQWFVYGVMQYIICGIVVSLLYSKNK
jgi:hypothetical protein